MEGVVLFDKFPRTHTHTQPPPKPKSPDEDRGTLSFSELLELHGPQNGFFSTAAGAPKPNEVKSAFFGTIKLDFCAEPPDRDK